MTIDRMRDLFEQRAERGDPRGAHIVWTDASEVPYVTGGSDPGRQHRLPTLAAAAVVAIVAIGTVVVLSRSNQHEPTVVAASSTELPEWASSPPDGTTVVIALLEVDDPVPLDQRRIELLEVAGVLDAAAVSRTRAYEQFTELFGDDPDMIGAITADEVPESVQLLVDANRVDEVTAALGTRPGVGQVTPAIYPSDGPSFDPSTPRECVIALVYLTPLLDFVPVGAPPTWWLDTPICERATAGLTR